MMTETELIQFIEEKNLADGEDVIRYSLHKDSFSFKTKKKGWTTIEF